ncbi:MAG TPA: GTPase ObgE [Dehalococcoidia bacterium]|nr:GTPase ObgE [Dehalococcoidia bacterium]
MAAASIGRWKNGWGLTAIRRRRSGGNGIVSFRREKFVPRGGPDGGDGGDGGDVILLADRSIRTLKEIGRRRIYQAERGVHGQGADKHGRRGETLVIRMPVGTQVSTMGTGETGEPVGDLVEDGQQMLVARGGRGGWGNARFKSSTNQTPRFAQRGQQGEEKRLRLDLKLLADVGIVGLPNAGKSTLLSVMSAARPKIADYPFTTLEPMLGVVESGWDRFVVADIPGLIEGAHTGAGLGLDFLRHIERTRVIVHLIDGGAPDVLADYQAVVAELREYGHGLADRTRIVAVNKIDVPEVSARTAELTEMFRGVGCEPMFISAAAGTGVQALIQRMAEALAAEMPAAGATKPPVLRPLPAQRVVSVAREDGAFRVEGERVVAFAEMMPLEEEEARAELWRRFQRWGVTSALRRAGARPGDRVRIGGREIELVG